MTNQKSKYDHTQINVCGFLLEKGEIEMNEARRKYGEGYLRETAAGTIEYRFRYTDEYGRRKYKSVSGVNEEHCYERAEMFLAELESKKNYIDYNVSIVKLMREEIEADYKKKHDIIELAT